MDHTFSICPHCKSLVKLNRTKALKQTPLCGKCKEELQLHGLVTEVSEENFERILAKSDLPVVVDFWASWCGPCRTYGPKYQKASEQSNRAVFLKVNTETSQRLAQRLGIKGIPCTILFVEGKEVKRQSGAMGIDQVKSFIG
ncbi:MAG: thioredoxin family protein [Bacteriovoracaceae bacterium]